ncbi:MAG: flagellar basal-body rod protein FlgG [Bacteroidales bacterium]|nr:flagellar basal-body rod protein FlgG [Clostridium sp.]MCM1203815.1 flagellar basal-body rod protein FlgG [Bacteroidales bacterium]
MMRSLWSAASGMIAQQTNLDTIANNLSNVNTAGYKKDTAEFKSLLYQTLQSTSTNNVGENKPVPAQVGLGTRTSSITTVFTQGNLQATDNNTYMAIEGSGFFKVRDTDGNICYTRDGSFCLQPTANGGSMLCTSQGYPVLDQNNNPIIIPAGYKTGEITVDAEGNIFKTDMHEDVTPLTARNGRRTYNQRIGLVQFNNPSGLYSAGGNLYTETVASGAPLEESRTRGIKTSLIHQKYLEMSNVQVADEMVNMIVAQRAYEMNSKAIQASDEMLQQANNLRG